MHGLQSIETGAEYARIIQVPVEANQLDSTDCFVLVSATVAVSWIGCLSSLIAREVTRGVSNELDKLYGVNSSRKWVTCQEGTEPDFFWDLLGGQTAYAASAAAASIPRKEPRLFECSDVLGHFGAEEVI